MSSASAAQTTTRLRIPETVRIVNWPVRDGGVRVWLTVVAVVAASIAAGLVSGIPAMGFVCFVALMLSCWRLWLRVTFELGTRGVTQSTLVFRWRVPWRCIARYEKRPHGVWLLSDVEPSPISTLRGIYVPCADQEDQLLAVLDFFLAARRQSEAGTTRTYAS